jgi:ankyrin repeat protein
MMPEKPCMQAEQIVVRIGQSLSASYIILTAQFRRDRLECVIAYRPTGDRMTEHTHSIDKPALDDDALAFAQKIFDLARNGETDALRPLLDAGLPVDILTSSGDSLLMLASYHGHEAASRLLLERGADPELANGRAQTPLAGVVFKGDTAIVRLLLSFNAAVDGRPEGGKTPLMYAAMFDRTDMLELLLDAGAQIDARDDDQRDALDYANAMGAKAAIALLEARL